MTKLETDLLVIGGGINGVGLAVDAAGRGLSVILCEKDDLANHTSSASSNLIHGGLRYLENFDFKLVREALREREILMYKAPYLITPLPFILPHDKHLRPAWMIRLGLLLYDHLAKRRKLIASRKIDLQHCIEGEPLQNKFKIGFKYADCQTDDARLVITNAKAARSLGANILPRTECIRYEIVNNQLAVYCRDKITQKEFLIYPKAIVNAAGAWVVDVLKRIFAITTHSNLKWVKGSHLVIKKFYSGDHAYILQNHDQRIVFVTPYKDKFVLIGTTDVTYKGDINKIEIDNNEIEYLFSAFNYYFNQPIHDNAICWTYSGVRALYDDKQDNPSKITRGYHFELDSLNNVPILSVFGGKVTTFRCLAEEALEKLRPFFPKMGQIWTDHTHLPGGDFGEYTLSEYNNRLQQYFPWLPYPLLKRYLSQYGTLTEEILDGTDKIKDLGMHYGSGLYQREMDYLQQQEWAYSVEDIIWRRTKLGLQLSQEEINFIHERLTIR